MARIPDLEIIILTYNSQFWLKKALSTLKTHYLEQTKLAVQVTVVDNCSQDDTLRVLAQEFKWVHVIPLKENNGFAAGNNVALQASQARYRMLMNSDVECTAESNFDLLIEYLEAHPEVGIVTPKVVFSGGKIDPACHRGEPTLWASLTYFARLEKLFPKLTVFSGYHQWYKDLDTIHEIDACSGAAMIARGTAVDQVGLLDERFFMYAEDLDWCHRFRDASYSIIYHPEVQVIHHKYKSGIKGSSKKIARSTHRHFYDTMLQYYDKYYRAQYPEFVRAVIKYFTVIKKGAV